MGADKGFVIPGFSDNKIVWAIEVLENGGDSPTKTEKIGEPNKESDNKGQKSNNSQISFYLFH